MLNFHSWNYDNADSRQNLTAESVSDQTVDCFARMYTREIVRYKNTYYNRPVCNLKLIIDRVLQKKYFVCESCPNANQEDFPKTPAFDPVKGPDGKVNSHRNNGARQDDAVSEG